MNKFLFFALIFSTIFISCKSAKLSGNKSTGTFDLQGHRGARGLMPENTIPAMLKAIDLGVNTLEMDVVFTSDNVAIVSHEPFFNGAITTFPASDEDEKKSNIYKMTYAETQRYDVGLKGNSSFPEQQKMAVRKPSLSSLIDSVEAYAAKKNKSIFYNIETKTNPATDGTFHPAPVAFTDMLMKVIRDKGISDRVTVQSFDIRTLKHLHSKYPNIKTSLLADAGNRSSFRKQLDDLGFDPAIYSPEESLVTENLIKACYEKNIRIIPWTVNDSKRIRELKKMGVDGIITDYPNRAN